MPRRRASQTSISSEQSTSSEQSENLTIIEFPDVEIPGCRRKGSKKKKSVSFNLDDGKSKAGAIDLTEAGPSTGDASDTETKEQAEEILDLTQEDKENPFEKPPCTKGKKSSKKKGAAAQKKKKELEKPTNQDPHDLNKLYKIGDCLKYMNIELHPDLHAMWYMSELPGEASRVGVRVIPATDICDSNVLMWTRTLMREITTQDGKVVLSPCKKQADKALYIVGAARVATLVATHALTQHMALKRELIGGKLVLVVFAHNDYFKKSTRRVANGIQQSMTEIDLEMAITDLLIALKMETILVNTSNELASMIIHFTRAVAEEPFKRARRDIDEQAQFYMRGDNKNCVAVDKDGNGLSRLWQQMIAVLPMSSLEISRALGAEYKSPRALTTELSTESGLSRVSDLGVSRAAAPSARPRRLGPEFARKLQTLFTAEDGDTVIE